jgi:exodeoxyribonuclease-3
VKLATWNVNSIRVRTDAIRDWLGRHQPDVLCLQETKVIDELFPGGSFTDLGYNAVFTGEKTYNGVALLSRGQVADVRIEFPIPATEERRLISGVYQGVRIYSAYIPNGRDPGHPNFQYKLAWIDALGEIIGRELAAQGPEARVAVLGDYNVAPEPRDVYDPVAVEGHILYHADERAALQRLLDRGLVDAFRVARDEAGIYSWWDYRINAFKRKLGFRIDHVWTSPVLASHVMDAYVDVEERARERASDHAPVVVEFDL